MFRWLAALLTLLALAAGVAYVVAGRGVPPRVTINQPARFIGQSGSLDVTAEAPNARFTTLAIVLEQNGRTVPLFALDNRQQATVSPVDRHQLRISRPLGKQSVPELHAGSARIVVTATRPSFLTLRQLTSTASKDVQVRLEPPRIAVVSTKHYVNHGGSEMVIYRATPADAASGVRVGDIEYRGFPASGAGIGVTSPDRGARAPGVNNDLNVAFFAVLHDQDLRAPIAAFVRDEAGNEAKATFIDNVFPKPFKKSRIELDDTFIGRVVPEIVEHSPELNMTAPAQGSPEMIAAFVKVNGDLRKINADHISAFAARTSPNKLWDGPFVQLGNSQVEASFADRRTYFYKGKEVDRQTHLGFDLAVTSRVAVVAANAGTVLHASWLGIYGKCVILDHGMGVQSLYGHLSSFDVKVGDTVTRGQTMGRSGMTGLAGGDHLHFTMLVDGRMVTPVEWWDAHWIADRVQRKLDEARSK